MSRVLLLLSLSSERLLSESRERRSLAERERVGDVGAPGERGVDAALPGAVCGAETKGCCCDKREGPAVAAVVGVAVEARDMSHGGGETRTSGEAGLV